MDIRIVPLTFAILVSANCLVSAQTEPSQGEKSMELGNFSVSLAVKDIKASNEFYRKLGFKQVGGDIEQNWIVLQNETATIGLFQGMFEKNLLTFNPGWNRSSETLPEFQDVRVLQARLKEKGIVPIVNTDPKGTNPAHFVIADPDGNQILIDQHVKAPESP